MSKLDAADLPTGRVLTASGVARALRRGAVLDDEEFDRFLPVASRVASGQHWTPLVVILRVAQWLKELGVGTVVDLGSGAGKFCVAAALASRSSFLGVEQRPHLVDGARQLARDLGVSERARFVTGTLGEIEIPAAEAYYLYNPFGENLFGDVNRVDDRVELSAERFRRDVAHVEAFLTRAPVGTYIIKYNGFGGRMPSDYRPIFVDREMPNVLRMWRKIAG